MFKISTILLLTLSLSACNLDSNPMEQLTGKIISPCGPYEAITLIDETTASVTSLGEAYDVPLARTENGFILQDETGDEVFVINEGDTPSVSYTGNGILGNQDSGTCSQVDVPAQFAKSFPTDGQFHAFHAMGVLKSSGLTFYRSQWADLRNESPWGKNESIDWKNPRNFTLKYSDISGVDCKILLAWDPMGIFSRAAGILVDGKAFKSVTSIDNAKAACANGPVDIQIIAAG